MAICLCCQQPVMQSKSCIPDPIYFYDGKRFDPVPYRDTSYCRGCGVAFGGTHHPGCEHERCPRCQGLLSDCGCLGDAD